MIFKKMLGMCGRVVVEKAARTVGRTASGALRRVPKMGPALIGLLFTGAVAAQGASGIDLQKKEVTIGAFTPVTGPVPFYHALTDAANSLFRATNEAGGMNGWKINYITLDDGYEPARSVAATRKLVEDNNIFALVVAVGTATNVAVIPYAKEKGLPMIGPLGGSSRFFVEPGVFPLQPDYGWSSAASAEYALEDLGKKRIALVWQNDDLGRSAKRGFDVYLKSKNITPVESISIDVRTVDFAPHIRRLQAANADAVLVFGTNANLAGALKAASRANYKASWFGAFFTAESSTYKLAGDLLDGVYFSSWLLPVDSDEPQVAAFREAYRKYYPNNQQGVIALNGWTHASLFKLAFERLAKSGKPINRDNLMAVLNEFRDVNVGGARNISYRQDDHRGVRQEMMLRAEKGSFKVVRDAKPYPAAAFNQKLD